MDWSWSCDGLSRACNVGEEACWAAAGTMPWRHRQRQKQRKHMALGIRQFSWDFVSLFL